MAAGECWRRPDDRHGSCRWNSRERRALRAWHLQIVEPAIDALAVDAIGSVEYNAGRAFGVLSPWQATLHLPTIENPSLV